MPFYMLADGQQCGHNGRDLTPGEVVALPVHVGLELRGKLVPCTADGESLAHLDPVALQIAQAEPHERPSLAAALMPVLEPVTKTPSAPEVPVVTTAPMVRTMGEVGPKKK